MRLMYRVLLCCICVFLCSTSVWASETETRVLTKLFAKENLRHSDAVLISDGSAQALYEWQAEKPLVPASLVKLVTAHIAIKRWGLDKRFVTDFYRQQNTLWVKGYGDPYLVSEELDALAEQLQKLGVNWVEKIAIDNSYFANQTVPGRSGVADPYNAPLSAVSANFNTAKLINSDTGLQSAESQTPLTATAVDVANKLGLANIGLAKRGKSERVNLLNAGNAAKHFAEILSLKLSVKPSPPIVLGQTLPTDAKLIYQHKNSRSLADSLRGMLEFSNNFIANQLFLGLACQAPLRFADAGNVAVNQLKADFAWENFALIEGSGLSRENKLSAQQIDDLLSSLSAHKELLKAYPVNTPQANVRAKTGTLNGVRSFAGFITFIDTNKEYRFVLNFNRQMPYRYREKLMRNIVSALHHATTQQQTQG